MAVLMGLRPTNRNENPSEHVPRVFNRLQGAFDRADPLSSGFSRLRGGTRLKARLSRNPCRKLLISLDWSILQQSSKYPPFAAEFLTPVTGLPGPFMLKARPTKEIRRGPARNGIGVVQFARRHVPQSEQYWAWATLPTRPVAPF